MSVKNKEIQFSELILERIMDIASGMLKSGGEIKRVEETVTRLCSAYGACASEVLAITSGIIVTAKFENRPAITQSYRMKKQRVDMIELEFYNQLSREICAYPMTNEQILERLKSRAKKKVNNFLMAFVWAVVSASFTLFFGGESKDAIVGFFIGAVLYLVYDLLSKKIDNYYCVMILCSIFGGFLPFLLKAFNLHINSFYINIGNIMLLIPGVALTTAIRNMFSGDTISGLLEFFESILIGLVIAFGFAIMNSNYTVGSASRLYLVEIATALIGSLGFSVIFNCRIKIGILGAIGGMLGWIIVVLLTLLNVSEYIAFFIAAMIITLYSRIMATVKKCPATPFLRASIIPLVPGKALYLTMVYALNEEWQLLFQQGISTILYAVCISSGILLISTVFELRDSIKKT